MAVITASRVQSAILATQFDLTNYCRCPTRNCDLPRSYHTADFVCRPESECCSFRGSVFRSINNPDSFLLHCVECNSSSWLYVLHGVFSSRITNPPWTSKTHVFGLFSLVRWSALCKYWLEVSWRHHWDLIPRGCECCPRAAHKWHAAIVNKS
jgi:hypothetical protein